ncbi:MAG: hypothetical protein K9I85_11705 [Saprospiraceae bacterium]|nr:hypothetical protein [Saprospiraceae bacterium]
MSRVAIHILLIISLIFTYVNLDIHEDEVELINVDLAKNNLWHAMSLATQFPASTIDDFAFYNRVALHSKYDEGTPYKYFIRNIVDNSIQSQGYWTATDSIVQNLYQQTLSDYIRINDELGVNQQFQEKNYSFKLGSVIDTSNYRYLPLLSILKKIPDIQRQSSIFENEYYNSELITEYSSSAFSDSSARICYALYNKDHLLFFDSLFINGHELKINNYSLKIPSQWFREKDNLIKIKARSGREYSRKINREDLIYGISF